MNKKLNTVVFIVVGTIVDVILAFVFASALLLILYACRDLVPPNAMSTMVPVAVIGGIILAMLVYQKVAAWIIEKFNMENKLSSLFKSKKNNGD